MENPEQQLQQFRDRIDAVDEQLFRLLIERIGIIREVAKLKGKYWPKACHIRPGREGRMHQAVAKRFLGTGFAPLTALAMWRQLIGGSTHVESPLKVTYLERYPEHQFLAREYFGVQVGTSRASTLAEAIASLRAGKSTILVLPAPSHPNSPLEGESKSASRKAPRDSVGGMGGGESVTPHDSAAASGLASSAPPQGGSWGADDWWKDTQALQAAGLFIFAQLPVVHDNLPEGCTRAVALAALTPEDSGNDVSYFVSTASGQPQLDIVAGFQATRDGAIFIGAHPDAIHLSQSQGVMYA